MGEALALTAAELETLRVAALLHDVGMSAAGETVEVSGRPLSTVEWGMLKMHPLVAVDILSQVPALAEVVPLVRHHHERWDGSGYVAGIAKDEIPLGSRILSVADAFVAMTSERPYRPSMSSGQALAELAAHAGTQFDPRVVRVFAEQVLESGTGAAPSEPVPGEHNDRPEAAVGEVLFRAED
jgi:HD-GYP domain-containing protein (c-di-GMP phosphodiesterase class II)